MRPRLACLGPSAAVGAAGLTAPSSLTATGVSQTRIDLGWRDNAIKESGFEVHRSATGASGAFTLHATTGANVLTYIDEGLASASGYCYRARAVRRSGKSVTYSAFSNIACAVTLTPPPPPPTPPPAAASGALAAPSSSSSVAVSWTDNSSNEVGFRFHRSFDGGTVWEVFNGIAGADVTFWENLPAVSEQQVCYRVIAFNDGGEAPPSNAACTIPPARPTNLSAARIDAETLALLWSDNSTVEDGYQVWLIQENCIGFCDAFDPLCYNYVMCPQLTLVAVLPANSTGYTGRHPLFDAGLYRYELLYIVATRDGGRSTGSEWVPIP
jgi:titin